MTGVHFLVILLGCVLSAGLVAALWLWREGKR